MKDLNEIRLTGRLTRDPETSVASTGNTGAKFTLAVDRGKDRDGKDKGAYFVPCQAWGKTAELVAKWCAKGKKVLICGKLFVSQYEKDGEKKVFTGIDVENFYLMERPEARREEAVTDGSTVEERRAAQPSTPPAQKAAAKPAAPKDREPGDDLEDMPF